MPARKVNVRMFIERIANDCGLDLNRPSDVRRAADTLCASLRYRVSNALYVR